MMGNIPDEKDRQTTIARPMGGMTPVMRSMRPSGSTRVVLTIARLIAAQIAREHFATLQAANDNRPPLRDGAGQDAGDED